jgi:hypothetical protein
MPGKRLRTTDDVGVTSLHDNGDFFHTTVAFI